MKNPCLRYVLTAGLVGITLNMHGTANAQTVSDYPDDECNISLSGVPGASCARMAMGGSISATSGYPGMNEAICAATTGCYDAVRSDPSSSPISIPIDVWGTCRYVDNFSISATGNSIFIPFRTALEWDAFRNTLDSNGLLNVSGTHCSKAAPSSNWAVGAGFAYRVWDAASGSDINLCDPTSLPIPQFYARWPDQSRASVWQPAQSSILCNKGMTVVNVGLTWYGVDADSPFISNDPNAGPGVTNVSWFADLEYGPNITLNASAAGYTMTGNIITVPAGTPVTLEWHGGDVVGSTGPRPTAARVDITQGCLGTPCAPAFTSTSYVQSIAWSVQDVGSTSPAPPPVSGLTFLQQISPDSWGYSYPVVTPTETTTYTITATGDNGVTSKVSVTVMVSP